MNPHQQNKIDVSKLSPEEQKLFRMYGKVPNRKDLLQNKMKERKYFDSGDYALSKAGKASDAGVTSIGREHPDPEKIPHHTGTPINGSMNHSKPGNINGQNSRPVKETSYLQRETSASDMEDEEKPAGKEGAIKPMS